MADLKTLYEKHRLAWDECASTYERQIVCGHPDITAFEQFEEDFLDRVLALLCGEQERPVRLIDVGCGSGRLHVRYGAQTADDRELGDEHPLHRLRGTGCGLAHDPRLAGRLTQVHGIDFSDQMVRLASEKIAQCGLAAARGADLTLEQGSAFELEPEPDDHLPVAVCLINSISVMQGPEGARELFGSMRRAVEKARGIAIISCYQREYLPSYGLGQYESTLDVSGQPVWLKPDDHARQGMRLVARDYKRAWSDDDSLIVDVFDERGTLVEEGFLLRRDAMATMRTMETGQIRTHTDYESNWYGYWEIDEWTRELWPEPRHHFATIRLDALRAEPAQMAILDCGDHLGERLSLWGAID